jgi:glucan-binding YG repeat protein
MEVTLMKALGVISTTALFLFLGASIPAFAQEEHHEEAAKPEKQQEAKPKPAQQEEKTKPAKQEEQAKPEKQQEQAKGQQEQQQKKQEQANSTKQEEQKQAKGQQEQQQKKQEQANSAKQEEQKQAKGQQEQQQKQQQAKQVQQEEGGQAAGQQHAQRTPAEDKRQHAEPALRLSARGEGRIPDERFRSNFGREHEFRIESPRLVDGYSRFQYGGFWFGFVQPWPVAWYYTDDVYVDFIDGGYYLCNPYYPGDRVAISVVL